MSACDLEAWHTIQLAELCEAEDTWPVGKNDKPDLIGIAETYLAQLEAALKKNDLQAIQYLMCEKGWWRDHLALTFDFRTLRYLPAIVSFLEPILPQVGLRDLKVQDSGKFAPHVVELSEGLKWIVFMFSFETALGRGKGILRLKPVQEGHYKAHIIYTALQELHTFKEMIRDNRPHGGDDSLGNATGKAFWQKRQRKKEFLDEKPAVLVIGAGQSGLNMGARLQALGVPCVLIDRSVRVGDSWRHRYKTLVTHDPVHYCHIAYMSFPSNWPLFTPKDMMADWLESYATAMELNVWLQSTVSSAEFDDNKRSWKVDIAQSNGVIRTVKPRHIVFCTGYAGEPRLQSFPGQDNFRGIIYHGSQHKDATVFGTDLSGKRVLVVGTGNAGHDIAQNYYSLGASVTMVQRGGTYIMSSNPGLKIVHEGLYDEHGPPTEDADIFLKSLPIPVQFALNVEVTNKIKAADEVTLQGLQNVGFKLDFGINDSGIFRKFLTRGGGYYIDVGASELLIKEKIKLEQSPGGIKGFTSTGLILDDDRELSADVVILALGYDSMNVSLRQILGNKVADRCRDVWDLDGEGEINGMWRPSGHPGLWIFGGSIAYGRMYSKLLALQIKASIESLPGAQL